MTTHSLLSPWISPQRKFTYSEYALSEFKLSDFQIIFLCFRHPYLAFGTVGGEVGVLDISNMQLRHTWKNIDLESGVSTAPQRPSVLRKSDSRNNLFLLGIRCIWNHSCPVEPSRASDLLHWISGSNCLSLESFRWCLRWWWRSIGYLARSHSSCQWYTSFTC